MDYLAGHLDQLAGEHRNRPPAWALATQLAGWSNLANRHAGDPGVSSPNLHQIAHTQQALLNAAVAVAGAAIDRGELPAKSGPHLLRRLDAAAAQRAMVTEQWTWARTPDAPRSTSENDQRIRRPLRHHPGRRPGQRLMGQPERRRRPAHRPAPPADPAQHPREL